MDILHYAINGVQAPDIAIATARTLTGAFFFLSGANKIFNTGRHQALVNTLEKDKVPVLKFMQWWVPGWEFTAGALLTVGLFSSFAAAVLAIIMLVACTCEAKKRVAEYQPINKADVIDDYLYLPEVIYLLLLVTFVLTGGGRYSLDALLF